MSKPQPWPIFICYRRADGFLTARRLHEMLNQYEANGPDGQPIILDAYLDEDMPGVADWQALHGPYLERARAIIVVCTPGLKLNEGPEDWVHKELDWWLGSRTAAPILIDPLAQGARYVPDEVNNRWPNIQRLQLVEREWLGLSDAELKRKTEGVRRQILGAILPSGAEIYVQELEERRKREQGLKRALAVAEASSFDARAASQFAESRSIEARWDAEKNRQQGLQRELAALPLADVGMATRRSNLEYEIAQVNDLLQRLAADAASKRAEGNNELLTADTAWGALAAGGDHSAVASRSRPDPPGIFSIELINAGSGESILVHYGTPDATFLVMINGGDRAGFREFVEPRLREISEAKFGGGPVPVELFVASDQDGQKTEGLLQILRHLQATWTAGPRFIELRGVWANIFETVGQGLRPEIRQLIDTLGVPLNRPFDHLVMRPEQGRVNVTFPGGLDIVLLGPPLSRLAELHRVAEQKAKHENLVEMPLPSEKFTSLQIGRGSSPLSTPRATGSSERKSVANDHANSLAGGSYTDMSVANLASTILLLRFAGKTFLHTGDSRGDLILDGLAASGLLDPDGRAFVDLLHVPHHGSARNVTREFFEKVRANGYLLSGDGAFGSPAIANIASLIAGRGYAPYTMYFVNRDGGKNRRERDARTEHGKKLDAFFEEERAYAPLYQRVFRSNERGSLIIDLLDPVRY